MRSITLALVSALLWVGIPSPAQACLGQPNCAHEMYVTSIVCKSAIGDTTPPDSTCVGHDGWTTPTTIVDVAEFVDFGTSEDWRFTYGIDITLFRGKDFPGVPVWVDRLRDHWYIETRDREPYVSLRNFPSMYLPLMTGRCVSASDPASRVFDLFMAMEARGDIYHRPATRAFKVRIAPEGFVNPPHCP